MKTLILNLHKLFKINIAEFQFLNEVLFSLESRFKIFFSISDGGKILDKQLNGNCTTTRFIPLGKLPEREDGNPKGNSSYRHETLSYPAEEMTLTQSLGLHI